VSPDAADLCEVSSIRGNIMAIDAVLEAFFLE
jgi:hypothetical protein